MLHRLIGEDLRIEADLASDAWCVHADPGQLEQVLMNLLMNARDAMPGGGVVRVATANVCLDETEAARLSCPLPGDYLAMTVTDTGTGIPAHVLPNIFEPFFTTKELGKGTGLGLATAYGIVKQSGGHLLAEAMPEQGSRFTVYLPCDASLARATPLAPAAHEPAGQETILVVEDEVPVRHVVSRMLTSLGYQVVEAGDGVEALRLWDAIRDGVAGAPAQHVDLVLADLVMPHLGGRELAQRLRADRPDVRIVLMTGYTADAVGAQTDLGGASGFLQKPLTRSALAEQLHRALSDAPGTTARQ
jgi:CheY-like chemotaxis protein